MRYIIKRSGNKEEYDSDKIVAAVRKAFESTKTCVGEGELSGILEAVEARLSEDLEKELTVEMIQDTVEEALMEKGFFKEAKAYILYREKRSELRSARNHIAEIIGDERIAEVLSEAEKDFKGEEYSALRLDSKFSGFLKPDMTVEEKLEALIKAAVELTDETATRWENIAARILAFSFHRSLDTELKKRGLESFYDKLRYLTDEGLYGSYILESYSRSEIEEAEKLIDNNRDKLLNY